MIDDGRGNTTEYRLLTTLLDPVDAPAAELAVAYAQRWEIESTFDELKALEPLLHTQAMTVTGRSVGDNIPKQPASAPDVIAALDAPFQPPQGLAVVRGNLAPHGAVIKCAAATPELLKHRGPAVVFENVADLLARYDDPDRECRANGVNGSISSRREPERKGS